ncbi:MAG: histidine kinase [Clostridia bacterium]|nr:histidine kinase [Clostridia bacterium]
MKTSYKMILIFTAVMIAAVTFFAILATRLFRESSDAYDTALEESRMESLGSASLKALEQQTRMMKLAIDEVLESPTLMATLNQFVRDRDESGDSKMAIAARNSVLQYLYTSPLVESFYRMTFFTSDGRFITSNQDNNTMTSGSEEAIQAIRSLKLPEVLETQPEDPLLMPLHDDLLSATRDSQVFGLGWAVFFHGNHLGYIEVSEKAEELDGIFSILTDDYRSVRVVFDDGSLYYASDDLGADCSLTLPLNEIAEWAPDGSDTKYHVMRLRSEELGLNLFLIDEMPSVNARNSGILGRFIRIALMIAVPAFVLIVLVTRRLTRSVRLFTKKVEQTPIEQVLGNDPEAIHSLNETVTRADDAEIHKLEHVYNDMMLRLRDSAANEMMLREGALQARLSALQSQINPHFVYNTLNIISAKSMESGNLDVIEICDQFASMLRYATDTRSRTATLREEIANARNYLLLAKARYEENLDFTIDIPEDLAGVTIPKLTLQPIVENALIHGYDGQNMQRRLSITGRKEAHQLILEISDNGTGFSPDALIRLRTALLSIEEGNAPVMGTDGHIGLANTYQRLYYYSQGAMHMHIENRDGAVVQLMFPC